MYGVRSLTLRNTLLSKEMTPEQVILKICRAAPYGVTSDTIRANLPELDRDKQSLVLLKLVREGKIWLWSGLFCTKAHYEQRKKEWYDKEFGENKVEE